MTEKTQQKQRLKKQPRMRRVYSTSAAVTPNLAIPKAAKKRKWRNSHQRISKPLGGVMGIVLSTRWISLAIAGLCIYGLYLIGSDDRYYLNYIPVEGANTIQATTIVEASELAGHHIFAADPQEAAEKIKAFPGVITTTVTLHWPNDILIQIQEQPPLASWQEGDQKYWINENGGLIPARNESIGLLNIISEIPPRPITVSTTDDAALADNLNDEASGDNAAVDEAALSSESGAQAAFVPMPVLRGALQLRQLRPNIDQLYYRPLGGLSYLDGRGWRAYFGAGEDMHQKLVVYETLVEELLAQGQRPEYISVSNQHKPFYKVAP